MQLERGLIHQENRLRKIFSEARHTIKLLCISELPPATWSSTCLGMHSVLTTNVKQNKLAAIGMLICLVKSA